jgi:RNA polymerase sigma-70 factor (ECF subfamily)
MTLIGERLTNQEASVVRTAPPKSTPPSEPLAKITRRYFGKTALAAGAGFLLSPTFELAGEPARLPTPSPRPIPVSSGPSVASEAIEDSDRELVTEAQGGSLEAFETLIRRNTSCVYRTLMAILANSDEAADAMQDVFLKAFKHVSDFHGRSKFSTWLVSIARNTAIQRLRDRRNIDSLDNGASEGDEEFCPRQVRAWQDDPEMMYSRAEVRELVEKGLMQLPAKLRVVVMLRDIEQLSTDEAARVLGLSVPALKARLFRGRLMLRELLSAHFVA